MAKVKESLDELLALGELDMFLEKVKIRTEQKIRNTQFAGMEIDDVVQEVLIHVYNNIEKYDSSRAKATTYFNHVINNRIKYCLAKAGSLYNLMVSNAKTLVDQPDGKDKGFDIRYCASVSTNDSSYSYVENVIDIFNSAGLTDREKEIFRLRAAGYTFSEIGNILSCNKSNARNIFKNAQRKIKVLYS